MSLHLTPTLLESTYELLRLTLPFSRWKLPPADDVEFHVTRHIDRHGDCTSEKDPNTRKRIRISSRRTYWTNTLIETMAHEMLHLHLNGQDGRLKHGPQFKRHALRICNYHGFDPKHF